MTYLVWYYQNGTPTLWYSGNDAEEAERSLIMIWDIGHPEAWMEEYLLSDPL